ncbi:protein-export chaperone SecB [Apilactobacillus quenuiae]|uniref:protein-export chaperone SecB n=1 Tax=Apilactobacillus quenuiae TaxID=2008377 RepID=UPI000D01FCA6|nr:protein-export chaperone SecB [Apilactobacillus quenuiae]
MSDTNPIKNMSFLNYSINSFDYKRNVNFKKSPDNKLKLDNEFHSIIYFSKKESPKDALINIKVKVGGVEKDNTPFLLNIDISGAFKFSFVSGDFSDVQIADGLKYALANDGNNLMFPYVRSLISELTLKSNMFPACVLPIVNFSKILKENNRIKFIDLDDKD